MSAELLASLVPLYCTTLRLAFILDASLLLVIVVAVLATCSIKFRPHFFASLRLVNSRAPLAQGRALTTLVYPRLLLPAQSECHVS